MKSNEVVLCPICVPMTCCPVLSIKDNFITIVDDYDQKIKIPIKESNELISSINKTLSLHRSSMDN
jgi:hypothetical protein